MEMHVHHRAHPAPDPMGLALRDDPTRLELTGHVQPTSATLDLGERVLELLRHRPASRTRLRAMLRVRNERPGAVLDRLELAHRIVRTEGMCSVVPVPALRDQRERNDRTATDP